MHLRNQEALRIFCEDLAYLKRHGQRMCVDFGWVTVARNASCRRRAEAADRRAKRELKV